MQFAISTPKGSQKSKAWRNVFILFGFLNVSQNEDRPPNKKLVLLRRLKTRIKSNGVRFWVPAK